VTPAHCPRSQPPGLAPGYFLFAGAKPAPARSRSVDFGRGIVVRKKIGPAVLVSVPESSRMNVNGRAPTALEASEISGFAWFVLVLTVWNYFDAEGLTLQQFSEFLRYFKGLVSYGSVGLRTAVFESVPRNEGLVTWFAKLK
jgi:hypothetical protein